MAGDDEVLDAVVGLLGHDAAADELVLGGVGAAVNDAFAVGVAYAGESLELVGSGGVNVEQICGGGGCGAAAGFVVLAAWAVLKIDAESRRTAARILWRRFGMFGSPLA